MRYRRLGRTGLLVSELCVGSNMFGGADLPAWNKLGGLDQSSTNAILKLAFDKGVNFIDTADVYAAGQSEERIGQALRDLGCARADIVIMTKAGTRMGPGPNAIGASRSHLLRAVEQSLQRLKTDYIDIYLIHHFDPATPIEETLRALDDIVRAGKVCYVGCSNFAAWQVMKSLGVCERLGIARLEVIEAQWSIATRDIERELVPMAIDQTVGILVWGPLVAGLLTGKYAPGGVGGGGGRLGGTIPGALNKDKVFKIIATLEEVAREHGATIGQVALAWILQQRGTTSVIVGSRSREQCAENLAAAEIRLSEQELAVLDSVSALDPEYGRSLTAGTPADRMRYA